MNPFAAKSQRTASSHTFTITSQKGQISVLVRCKTFPIKNSDNVTDEKKCC